MDSEQRLRAERALDSIPTTDPLSLQWPNVAAGIRQARLKSGLDESEIARQLGVSVSSYCDLEAYDDEAFTVATLRQLATLGRILGVEPKRLLLGTEAYGIDRTITFGEIAEHLVSRLAEPGVTVEHIGNEIGWVVEPSPDTFWELTVEALYAVCKYLGLDWVASLPDFAATPRDVRQNRATDSNL